MNDDAMNNATNQPATLDNEATPDAAVFSATAAAVAIAPDPHFLTSGLKIDTEILLNGNLNDMADKDTLNTPPATNAPDDNTPNADVQNAGSTDSSSPHSLINHKLTPYSTNTMKNQKKKEKKIDDKFTTDTPLLPPNN